MKKLSISSIAIPSSNRPPRVILTGVPKIGKSTFASKFPKSVVIPIIGEEGCDALGVPCTPVVTSYDELIATLLMLLNDRHSFYTVVIDSVSALEPLIWKEVCKRHGEKSIEKVLKGFGKGYQEAVYRWTEVTELLDELRNKRMMASVLIGHVKVKMFSDPIIGQYDRWIWNVNDKAADKMYQWSDVILFCNTKTVQVKEDAGFGNVDKRALDIGAAQRYLYTQQRPAHPGGGRGEYGRLPYEIPLDYNVFADCVAQAKALMQQQPVS